MIGRNFATKAAREGTSSTRPKGAASYCLAALNNDLARCNKSSMGRHATNQQCNPGT